MLRIKTYHLLLYSFFACIVDPYVKVYLMCGLKKLKKKKTSIQAKTLNPVFNESVVFDVPYDSIDEVDLHIKVFDHDVLGSDQLIGGIAIGPSYHHSHRQWREMLEKPRKQIDQTYTLVEQVDKRR